MATVGNLDFEGFVRAKRAKRPSEEGGRDDAHAYAYVSDRNTRKVFDTAKPWNWPWPRPGAACSARSARTSSSARPSRWGRSNSQGVRRHPARLETLGIQTPDALHPQQSDGQRLHLRHHDDAFIVVHSALVDHLSDDELLDVIGPSAGHIHNDHVVYLTALHYLRHHGGGVLPVDSWRRRWWRCRAGRRRAEITADRAGALCCGSVEISARALAKLALGSHKLYEQLDLEEFLAQYDEGQDGVGKFTEVTASHPWVPKRVKAMRAFGESKLFRERVGLDGGLSMDEVDEKECTKIIKVLG